MTDAINYWSNIGVATRPWHWHCLEHGRGRGLEQRVLWAQ